MADHTSDNWTEEQSLAWKSTVIPPFAIISLVCSIFALATYCIFDIQMQLLFV